MCICCTEVNAGTKSEAFEVDVVEGKVSVPTSDKQVDEKIGCWGYNEWEGKLLKSFLRMAEGRAKRAARGPECFEFEVCTLSVMATTRTMSAYGRAEAEKNLA